MSWTFLKNFAKNPVGVGAIAPSSTFLAKQMVEVADLKPEHWVVELGAGTGSFTREILSQIAIDHLLALEPEKELANVLRAQFPKIWIEEKYAQELPHLLENWGHPQVDRIISGLPWAIWPDDVQKACFDALIPSLKKSGRFTTFTYVHSQFLPAALRFRALLEQRFGKVTKSKVQWLNLPPAFIYICEQPLC